MRFSNADSVIKWGFVLCAFLISPMGVQAQQRPLLTEEVDIIRPGTIRLEVGFEFLQDQQFALSGLRGDPTAIGVVGVTMGLAPNVEFQIQGTVQNFLSIDQRGPSAIPLDLPRANSTNDVGDFTLSAKFLLRRESERVPAIGFRLGVQLPNTDQSRGLGTNQTNFLGTILMGKHLGRLNLWGNIGLGIFSAPVEPFAQNDMLLYGLAGAYRLTDQLHLVGEINGRANTRSGPAPLGTESQGQVRLGVRLRAGGLWWDVAGIKGLTEHSPDSGVTFGVRYEFRAFHPVDR
ncbi:MAG: hypothetical protein D6723_14265 [Acidobacteria bacterium]|nr:MAG: hypothetical protein D6723_14265 [Acidobacteriota bacterium]